MCVAEAITKTVEGRERYNVALLYPAALQQDPDAITREVQVALLGGGTITLGEAAVERSRGASAIRTENGLLVVYIFVYIAGRDLRGNVADAQSSVVGEVALPPGYSPAWSGKFGYLERVKAQLAVVVPLTLAVIFLLLFLNFRRMTENLIVMLSLPFALVGWVWLLWWMGFNSSVAVAVGFIALAGVAAETGVIMLIYLDQALAERRAEVAPAGRTLTHADLDAAIMVGAVERVRPKIMTVVAIMTGLMPILWAHGPGSEVMSRIAVAARRPKR